MRYPSIDTLLTIVDSKYNLCLIAAKRAKRLEEQTPILIEKPRSKKPVGIALEEILESKLV